MRRHSWIVLFAISVVASLAPHQSHGVLIEFDLRIDGDKLLTRDTQTGLEWLDLPATANLSVNDVLGGAGGFILDGFGYATEEQVRELWTNAGIPSFNTNSTTPGADLAGRVPENYAPIVALMGLIGCTGNCPPGGTDFTIGKAALNELVIDGAQSPFIEVFDGNGRAIVGSDVCCAGFDSKQPSAGNWLVRPFIVPEPATTIVFIVSLAGLGLIGGRCQPK